MKDVLLSMRIFVRVVEAGSFARAADTLGLPRPAVTRHIQSLEERLRTRLLNRTTRRLSVTPAGSLYHERVVRLLGELGQIDADFSDARQSARDRIRVDLPAALARVAVMPALPAFLARHPGVRIDVSTGERLPDLRADNVDLALQIGTVTVPTVVARQIGQIRYVTVAAPDYLRRHGLPHHPAELARNGHHVLGALVPGGGQRSPGLASGKTGARREAIPGERLRIDDAAALADAARAGAGVALVPHFLAERDLASGDLIAILADWPAPSVPLHIVTLPERYRSPAVGLFKDWLIERLGALVHADTPQLDVAWGHEGPGTHRHDAKLGQCGHPNSCPVLPCCSMPPTRNWCWSTTSRA